MTSSPPPPHHNQINTTVVTDGNSASTTATSTTAPWSSETNWMVSGGSLDSAVTFESFDFPIDSESTARKPPLILVPSSSSDFQPCEIKLNFTQKHEIRQVYVRSTARVYEIYYASGLQSEYEYLCTVRCSAASVGDNFFKEAVPVNLEGPNDMLPKRRVAGENIIGTNEDDWVEIKLPVGRLDEGNTYSPNGSSNNTRNYQNYYEATAEINDSEPCMSLTLRLLSLQSKGCVYVDEVYVFADTIDTNDSENQTVMAESSAGSSFMTMLVPTLLGLSKSGSRQLHDQQSSKSVVKLIETESGPAASTNPVNLADQQDERFLKQGEAKAELSRVQVPAPTPDRDEVCNSTMSNAFSYNRAEILLEQLVSRVSRIEDICIKFEENMLKPINSMEARLQRVEQQVELLSKTSKFPVSPSCPKFEPNPRLISNDGNDSQLCGESESEEQGSVSNVTNKPTQVHQGLMATAFESPHCDEKELVNDVSESPKKENPKKFTSIDDALAAALAGFSLFTKANDSLAAVPLESPKEECLKRNQAPIDTTLGSSGNDEASISCNSLKATDACEFAGEENDEATKSIEFTKKSSVIDVLDSAGDSATTSYDASAEIPDNNFHLQGTLEVVDEEASSPTASSSCSSSHKNFETDVRLVKQDSIKVVKISDFDKTEILKYFPDQSPDASCTTRVAPSRNAGDFNDGSETTVDFESGILEVKFASLENGSLRSHLEALLSYTDDPVTDDDVLITCPPSNVCSVKENTVTANNLLVELDCDHVGEDMQQDLSPVHEETSFDSLI